jgi:hypothetical protein
VWDAATGVITVVGGLITVCALLAPFLGKPGSSSTSSYRASTRGPSSAEDDWQRGLLAALRDAQVTNLQDIKKIL